MLVIMTTHAMYAVQYVTYNLRMYNHTTNCEALSVYVIRLPHTPWNISFSLRCKQTIPIFIELRAWNCLIYRLTLQDGNSIDESNRYVITLVPYRYMCVS